MASEEPKKKQVKVGVVTGGGPPPGYLWNVEIFDQAHAEAIGFLREHQYEHLANQFRELARQNDPTHSDTIDVRQIEEFHELRDKGGLLTNLNVRVFFFVHKPTRAIVVLGTIKKENNGPTPVGDRLRMRRRMRLYLENCDPPKE
jgi:hypothetical protein